MIECIKPDWPAPHNVQAMATTRLYPGGISEGNYINFNLGIYSGDSPAAVSANRDKLAEDISGQPLWLHQVHGRSVIDAGEHFEDIQADGCAAFAPNQVCTVLAADCLPVLLCDRQGSCVAAVHAGWRGLHAGILQQAVMKMRVPSQSLLAWLGPAISQQHYAVDEDFRERFVADNADYAAAFARLSRQWHANLYDIARIQLDAAGVAGIYGGGFCTFADSQHFYSYRRDGQTGRQACLIWMR